MTDQQEQALRAQWSSAPSPIAAGELGRFLFNAGKLDEAERLLTRAVADKTAFFTYWADYACLLADSGRADRALAFLQARTQGDPAAMRFHFLKELGVRERFGVIADLLGKSAPNSLEWLASSFWQAYGLYRQHRHDEAVRAFFHTASVGEVLWAAGQRPAFIPQFVMLGTTLVEDSAMEAAPAEPAPLEWLGEPACPTDGRPVVVMGCDDRYLIRFARDALAGMLGSGLTLTCHIHVMGADAEARAHVEALRAEFPTVTLGITIEPAPTEHAAVRYASARFQRAGQLLDHYRRDLVVVDVDSALTPEAARLPQAVGDADVACFRDPDELPWRHCLAGVVVLRDGAPARAFLRRLCRVLEDRIPAAPRWMLDQTAFYCALQRTERDEGFRFANLRDTFAELEEVLAPLCSGDDKHALRIAAMQQG